MTLSNGQEIRVSKDELANLTRGKGRATNPPYDPQYGELAARKYGAVSCDSCQHDEKESKWCAGCVKASLYSPRVSPSGNTKEAAKWIRKMLDNIAREAEPDEGGF